MKKQCDIIKDLLPLYLDHACSTASEKLVEEHLAECEECSKIRESMETAAYETALEEEKENVLAHHLKTQNRKTLAAGASIAGVLCIPIIVCLIVNLATGHALDWFFLVLTSVLVLASLLVVPLIAGKKKGLYTLFSFTGSLMLLLLTCALYTHGDWFFVAGTSVLFGLSVLFSPYLSFVLPLPAFWKKNKGLFVMLLDTVLFTAMLLAIGFYADSQAYWKNMPPLVFFNAGFLWILFLLCRYLRGSRFIRAGLSSILTGAYIFSVDHVVAKILGENRPWPAFRLDIWNIAAIDGNIKCLILIGSIFFGLSCIAIGIIRKCR